MSGFAADWLDLREPADHAARDQELASALAAAFAGHGAVTVTDLGCGTGSNLRALAPLLPARQHWRLVDRDGGLLLAAQDRLSAWADGAEPAENGLRLAKAGCEIAVSFCCLDLARDLEGALGPAPGLVTGAALFDLTSTEWIGTLAGAVVRRGAAFHAVLSYDGSEEWKPQHPADQAVHAAFLRHQARDKGFGPAAGPRAAGALAEAFTAAGYAVRVGRSPWRLDQAHGELIRRLAEGIAAAAGETGLPKALVAEWLKARRSAASCEVGHADVLALSRAQAAADPAAPRRSQSNSTSPSARA